MSSLIFFPFAPAFPLADLDDLECQIPFYTDISLNERTKFSKVLALNQILKLENEFQMIRTASIFSICEIFKCIINTI